MKRLDAYLQLIRQHPEWFRNMGEAGEIKIITDEKRIRSEQRRIRRRLRREGKPASWIEIGILAEDEWFYIVRDLVEFPDGKIGGYLRWINRKSNEEGGWNVILMCVQQELILLIRKFRHESRSWSWEFPRGFGEAGLSAEENALRELQQEIGVSQVELIRMAYIPEGKGGTAVFLAKIFSSSEILLDQHEGIQAYQWVSKPVLEEMIRQGYFQDPLSLWAYTLARISNLF